MALPQAVCGLEESGVVDQATWRALLGDAMTPTAPPVDVSHLLCGSL